MPAVTQQSSEKPTNTQSKMTVPQVTERTRSDILAWLLWISLAIFSRLDSFITETGHHVGQYHQITKKTPKKLEHLAQTLWLPTCNHVLVLWDWHNFP